MEAPMVYPTAPFETQAHQHAPTAHAGTGENVESSGKSKSVMSKVKHKARKLKGKIKKVTGSNTASTEHNNEHDKRDFNGMIGPDGEEVDDGAESYVDEEEADDHISEPNDKQFKYEQLRSIGALDKKGDGSEVEVRGGGVPVSTPASCPGTYWTSADDSAPISPYKNSGPPDALQATPTKYRNYAADEDPLLVRGEKKTASSTTNGLVEDIISRGPDEERNPRGSPSLPEFKTSNLSSYYEPAEPHSRDGVSDTLSSSDIDVPYPEDLVKPNPSFGKSTSPTHDKIAVMNEDLSADRKLGVGLSSEEHSKGNLLETSVPEFEELSGYQGSPSVPVEADKLVYRPVPDPELVSSLPSLPGTLDGAVYEPNAIVQSSGTGQTLGNTSSQFQDLSEKAVVLPRSGVDKMPSKGESDISPAGVYANETKYANSYGEQKPIFDTASDGVLVSEQPTDGGIATAGDSEHESWGKWSADKINNVKDITGLIGATNERKNSTDERGTKLNNAVDVVGDDDKVHNLQDYAKSGALEDVNKDAEEEFYDPNEVKDNQFQEGFALGSAEEDALSGTLTGAAIEKLQGLKETVASSLGYSNQDDNGRGGGGEKPGFEEEERALSPSHQQQKGGFVQGLKETVASSLGYGKSASDEASDNNDASERGEKSEIDVDNGQQHSGGTLQGLKNVVAAKLGYGKAAESPALMKETESREYPAEASSHEPLYDEGNEGGEHGNVIKAGHVFSDGRDSVHREDEVSSQQQSGGVLPGVKDMVISKLGYNSQPEQTSRDMSHTELASVPSGDHQPNSYTQKLFNTSAAASDYLSSKVGYGNSNKHKEERNSASEDDGEKFISPSTHVDNNIDDNNALSELITEKVSSTANMIGEKLRLSGTNQGPNVPASQPQH